MKYWDPQEKHEALVNLLNQFYIDKQDQFPIQKEQLNSSTFKDLSVNQINKSVALLVTANNLSGGSVSDVDLYVLLQKYLKDVDARKEINEILQKY